MNNISELKQELRNSIENLYKVFEKYDLRQNMVYCDCGCISPEDFSRIFSNSLRLLSSEDLERYFWKAMSTWGDSYDFRHFLPRLFELLTAESRLTADTEIIFSKLTYGDWRTWDQSEQEAVSKYFLVRWKLILFEEPRDEYTKTDEILCGIGRAVDDVSPFLDIWKNLGSISSYKHLHWFIYRNSTELPEKLGNAFWESREAQMQQVLTWLFSSDFGRHLAASANASVGKKKDAAIKIIHKLKSYSK